MCILIESSNCPDELFEGAVQIVVDDGEVEPVAVQCFDLLPGLNHGVKFVILEKKKISQQFVSLWDSETRDFATFVNFYIL